MKSHVSHRPHINPQAHWPTMSHCPSKCATLGVNFTHITKHICRVWCISIADITIHMYIVKSYYLVIDNCTLQPVVEVENQRWRKCALALSFITGGCGPPSIFVKLEVWECWISIIGGAGTAFLCIQWHFNDSL